MPGSRLLIKEAALDLHLGWGEDERRETQRVLFDLEISFARTPEACSSDELSGTVCYDAMIREIRARIRECRLIESLAARIHSIVTPMLPPGASLAVTIHKVALPVADVKEAVFVFAAPPAEHAILRREIPA